MKEEIWKPAPGYERLYQVSSMGGMKSGNRIVRCRNAVRTVRGRVLRQTLTTTGYPRVTLGERQLFKTKQTHRLVALAFLPPIPGKNYVNHKNGIKTDNRVENLEWCTFQENCQHAQDTGLNGARWKSRTIPISTASIVRELRRDTGLGATVIGHIVGIPRHVAGGIIYRGCYKEAV